MPEYRLDAEFALALNQAADVVAQELAQDFIFHGGVRLAPNVVPELCLDHAERRFDVAPLVIVLEEFFPMEAVVVEHPVPDAIAVGAAVHLERDVGCRADFLQQSKVFLAEIRLVARDFLDGEVFGRFLYQRHELRAIVGVAVRDEDGRNDIRFHPTNGVGLHPILTRALNSVFLVIPAYEPGRAEPGGIGSEDGFDRLQRQTALENQLLKDRREGVVLKERAHLHGRHRVDGVVLFVSVRKVTRKAARRERAVDLEGHGENRVPIPMRLVSAQSQRGRPLDGTAQVGEQFLKAMLLRALGKVVGGPVLFVGRSLRDNDRVDGKRLVAAVTFADKAGRVDVLARLRVESKVLAIAGLLSGLQDDVVQACAALRRNQPHAVLVADSASGRDFQALQLSQVHKAFLSLVERGNAPMAREGATGVTAPVASTSGVVTSNARGVCFVYWTKVRKNGGASARGVILCAAALVIAQTERGGRCRT